MIEDEIRRRLFNPEDHFVERKPEGANAAEIRKTLVAFANSVSDGQHAVLFLGVADNGTISGVGNVDSLQKKVAQIAKEDCFPPIEMTTQVLQKDGLNVIAAILPASTKRPHFTGHAYVRSGPQSIKASTELYEDLIASRNDKARRILAEKGKEVSVDWRGTGWRQAARNLNEEITPPNRRNYRVEACDAHCVKLEDLTFGRLLRLTLDKVQIGSVREDPTLELIVID